MSVRGDPGLTSLAPRAPPGRPRRAARSVDRARVFLSNAFASPARKDRRRSRPADPLPRRALSSPQGGKAEEVTWDDQQHICAFGRFNTRVHEVNAELKKMQQYRAELDAVREAELQRREVAKGPKVKTDAAISDDDESDADDDRKAKKERKKKKKRKHDSDEDSDERKERKRQKKERKRQKKEAKKAKKKESEPVRLSDFLRGGGSSSDSD